MRSNGLETFLQLSTLFLLAWPVYAVSSIDNISDILSRLRAVEERLYSSVSNASPGVLPGVALRPQGA
jgi:hypothetical protein